MSELSVDVAVFRKVYSLLLSVVKYGNDRTSIVAYDASDGDCFGRLTVNIPDEDQAEGEIFVKTWSENAEWVPQVMKALPHVFKDTGRRVRAGYAMAEVWEFTPDAEPVSLCAYCGMTIKHDGIGWVDETGGDACCWDGGNDQHNPHMKDESDE